MGSDPGAKPDGGLVRRVLSPGSTPEERLEALLAQRRHELDEHAAQLHASIAELERREELLRDSRSSVERMLRVGTSDLEAREAELTDYVRQLGERERELAEAEAVVARRRQELGAVELKRAAIERRERAAETREAELAEREAAMPTNAPAPAAEPVELAFVPGSRYTLVALEPVELAPGQELEVAEASFVVARVGPSPLPGDGRRCGYLAPGGRERDGSPSGSS